MKARVLIDIRKEDEWGLVGFEFGNTHRYLEKHIDLHFPSGILISNETIAALIQQAVNDCLDKELLKELNEEDSWKNEKN